MDEIVAKDFDIRTGEVLSNKTYFRRVILESPYAGDTRKHMAYARACVRDCLRRREAPIASHLLYTQIGILDDNDPEEREIGMVAGWSWMGGAEAVVVYTDYGISRGMSRGIEMADRFGLAVEMRELPVGAFDWPT